MATRRKKPRAPREPSLPGRFLRSKGGQPAQVVQSRKRDGRGRKLYRLWYGDVLGSKLWTREELLETTRRWMKRRPRDLAPRGG